MNLFKYYFTLGLDNQTASLNYLYNDFIIYSINIKSYNEVLISEKNLINHYYSIIDKPILFKRNLFIPIFYKYFTKDIQYQNYELGD